jgi:hypothetical protein
MPEFKRITGKFAYAGMDIHHPPDLLPEGRCSLLFNLQPDTISGALSLRPPIGLLATTIAGSPVHSICRVNDYVPEAAQSFSRFAGIGGSLYSGETGFIVAIDSGFSGNPLAMVPYRPAQSPESWLYVYDSMRQQRYKTDNATKQNIGIAAPTAEPSSARIQPLYDIVDNAANASLWSSGTLSGGTADAISQTTRVPASTTVAAILYDSGTTGMACISPANSGVAYAWMQSGSMITVDSEAMVIEQVFQALSATTVAAIAYDVGSTGPCTIVPAIPLPGMARNMMILLNGATYVRVTSVTTGPDGSYSFRCNTGAATISATQALAGVPSFRAWTTINHAASAAITGESLTCAFTPAISGGSMSGIVSTASPVTGNLSYVGARPLQNEDYMHLSVAFDQPGFVTEIHILLDVDSTTNDFNHNYYYYVLRQGDFEQSLTGAGGVSTLAAQSQAVSNAILSQLTASESVDAGSPQPPYPIPEVPSTSPPSPSQIQSGQIAWLEAMFKLNELTRVGGDTTRTLANVVKVGIYVFTSGGVVNMYWGGWWAGGGYGPDCNFNSYGNQAPEIQWRYRYRNSLTGAHSTVSPETRNGEILRRQGINLTAPNSLDAQVDYIDWERRGGTNPDWHYIGSVQQLGSSTTFLDNITENAAQIGDPLEVASYQPWPVTDIPHSGTATVIGTSVVWATGDKFNVRWLRGTEIIIGGNTYSAFAPPSSTTVLQLAQNVPPQFSGVVAFSIPEATIEGQLLYGAWLDESNNRILAVGDPLNPGLMYFANSDNPDGASDSGYIEITSPSEPLLNGFYAEGSNYVFTSSSLYRVQSTPGAADPYTPYRLSGVEGLAGAWAFDCQRRILHWWGPDGIYAYAFGAAGQNLTANDLYPLFPHAGIGQGGAGFGVPVSIHGVTIYPPNYAKSSLLRIGYGESFVYATYQNSAGITEALVYSLEAKGWRKDTYSPGAALFVLEKGIPNPVMMVGGNDGNVHQVSSQSPAPTADDGGPIEWLVLTPTKDAGDSRANKQWGDFILDYSTGANQLEQGLLVIYDNLLVDGANPGVPVSANRTQQVYDLLNLPDGNDQPLIHRNMALAISGTGPIFLYEWQPSYLSLPEDTTGRVTDWQTGGVLHYKYVQGLRLHANTYGAYKTFQIQFDGYRVAVNAAGNPLVVTVNFDGEQTQPISLPVPFRAHMMRLVPLDNVPWQVFPDTGWIIEPEPEPANYWISQPTALGQNGYLHARELWMAFAASQDGGVVSAVVDGGTPFTLATLPKAATPQKGYFTCPPLKGRYWQLTATGTGLQIYERDVEFLVKSWGSTGPYSRVRPFGDQSGGGGASGARI